MIPISNPLISHHETNSFVKRLMGKKSSIAPWVAGIGVSNTSAQNDQVRKLIVRDP